MPNEFFKLAKLEIEAFEYHATESNEPLLRITTKINAQIDSNEGAKLTDRAMMLNVLISNSKEPKDTLKLKIRAFVVFTFKDGSSERIENFMENEAFAVAYAELTRKVAAINASMGVPDIQLPEYNEKSKQQ